MPKRNASGGGSIRQRSNGTWEARYTTGRDPGTGKQVQRSIYGKTQAEVRRRLSKATADVDAGTYVEPAKVTVAEWMEKWVETYNQNVKESTRGLYRRVTSRRIIPGIGHIRLEKLSGTDVQEFYNRLPAEGLSAKSIRNIHGILHKALSRAVSLGMIPRNPADGCELPKKNQLEIHPFDRNTLQAFLIAIRGDEFERLFLVALYTGMRQGELLGLPWDAVDFKAHTIRVYQQIVLIETAPNRYERRLSSPKSGKERTFKAAPAVMDILREERAAQNGIRLIAGKTWADSGFVFTDQLGRGLPRNTVYEHFRRAAAAAGCPDARFHDLRHTFACSALESGVSPKAVSEMLGHASVAFTLDVYGHFTKRLAEDSADKMENFIQNLAK